MKIIRRLRVMPDVWECVVVITSGQAAEAPVEAQTRSPRESLFARPQAVLETALIVAGFVVLFFCMPHQIRGDDLKRLHDIQELLRYGKLDNSQYSIVMPLFSVPILLLGNVVESQKWWAGHVNVIFVAIGVTVAYFLLRRRYDPRLFRLTVLVMLGASFFTNRLRDWSVETFTSVLVALGIICLVQNRHVFWGWLGIIIGVVNTPAAIIALAMLACWQSARTRQLRHLLAIPAAAALIMLEAWIRRGGPFVTGYGKQGWTFPFVLGLFSILFSFGRGLIFFTPGIVLWLGRHWRRAPAREAVAMMLVFVFGLVLVYSSWWAWDGGISWGPRFFLIAAIPASILIATGIWRAGQSPVADAITLGVLALSAWVALSGAIADVTQVSGFCEGKGFSNEVLCNYDPRNSSLWQVVGHFPRITTLTAFVWVYIIVVFGYLAAPLAASVVRAVLPRRSWFAGWQI